MSLADELLADLEDLDAEDEGDVDADQAIINSSNAIETNGTPGHNDLDNGFDDFEASMDLDGAGSSGGPREVAKLLYSTAFQSALQDIDKYMGTTRTSIIGPVEEDPEYKLLVKVNTLTVEIDGEVSALHKYVRDNYNKRFPELEQLINSPIDYLRAVQMIGMNEGNMSPNNINCLKMCPFHTERIILFQNEISCNRSTKLTM